MIVTDDEGLAARARHLTMQARVPGPDYVHDEVGFNYRLSNLAAAVGLAQLEQLPKFIASKRAIADRYDSGLCETTLTCAPRAPWAESSSWLYSVLARDKSGRDSLRSGLADQGIETRSIWRPIHLQAPYSSAGCLGDVVAQSLFERALSLPSSVGLSESEQADVVRAIQDIDRRPR
jgi:dTDP-4-amino-4,6-dideoxygalactose transaminase